MPMQPSRRSFTKKPTQRFSKRAEKLASNWTKIERNKFLSAVKPKVANTKWGYQVMIYSPPTPNRNYATYIPQGQPYKSQQDAEKDAKSFELTPAQRAKWHKALTFGKYANLEWNDLYPKKI